MKIPPKLLIHGNILVAALRNRLGPSFERIAEKISAMETASFFEQRAALGSPNAAQAAWDKVGDKGALPDDQWTK
jgi:hypothetical protein